MATKKRKVQNNVERENTKKAAFEHPWRNLELILSLQNKDFSVQKKVELAFNYVKSSEEGSDVGESLETVSRSKVITFLNNWVQSLLISSEKKIRAEDYKPSNEITGSVLDFRCWNILKYCLEESSNQRVSLSFSRDFLRVVQCIAKTNVVSQESEETISVVSHCVSLVFSSHGGISNENLDLWILSVNAVAELIQRILDQNLESSKAGALGVKLTCVVLEPFAKFLRIHPNKKNGFRDFVDKLLEPLLHLLQSLHTRVHDSNPDSMHSLVKIIEEVLSHGLFHPSHMDGLLGLQSTRKYITPEEGKPVDSNVSVQSYHRHLFDKLEVICVGKNVVALNGVGDMFRLFARCVKRQKGSSIIGGLKHLGNELSSSENNREKAEISDTSCILNGETRKSLFDFFIQIMEPLLLGLNRHLEIGLKVGPALVDFQSIVSSANKVIVSFSKEKLYLRTEDISDGAFYNFLKLLYDKMLSLSVEIIQLWISKTDPKKKEIEKLNSIANEILSAIGCLVEIEYEVIGDDLESLWYVIFSFAGLGLSLPHAQDQRSVSEQTLQVGLQLVNLYSELRQVNVVFFTMCKVARALVLPEGPELPMSLKFKSGETVLSCKIYAESVCAVLSSQDVRRAIYNAVVSIPEGQVSGCIRQLKVDFLESLVWIKDNRSSSTQPDNGEPCPSTSKLHSDARAELFARGLCDIYTLIMDSLTVTAGNCNLIRVSIEELMNVLRLNMKSLVAVQQDSLAEFLSTITGRTRSDWDTQWILLFFFRLYMSCRSFYRQVMSLVPVDTSEKMSTEMGDSLTAYCGKDWLERTDWNFGSYFSWIVDSSSSLVTVIHSISDKFLINDADTCCSPLVYVLNTMAIQRLVDLNRLIKSLEYLLQRNDYLVQNTSSDDAVSVSMGKSLRRCQKCILSLRQEAADLTHFLIGHLDSLSEKIMYSPLSDDALHKGFNVHPLPRCGMLQLDASSINDNTLPLALWWMICQSIDVWCLHAAKSKLKLFLSVVIETFLLRDYTSFDGFALPGRVEGNHLARTVVCNMSLELLRDTVFYEERFVRRHIASSFCRSLEKSILAIFSNIGEVHLESSPNWAEFSSLLEKSSENSGKNLHMDDSTSEAKTVSHSSKKKSKKSVNEQKPSIQQSLKFPDCIALFNLMCWMPKGHLSSKSFSLYATCFINIERLVVGSILDCSNSVFCKNFHMLLRLFLSCRRALKKLLIGYCEEKLEPSESSVAMIFLQNSAPVLWLLKSLTAVPVTLQAYSDEGVTRNKDMVFSLMDHTSHVFLTLSKYQLTHEWKTFIDSKPSSESSIIVEGLKSIVFVAETLNEQMNSALLRRKAQRGEIKLLELNNLAAVLSCSQGFWWGFAAALDQIDSETCNIKNEVSKSKHEPIAKVRRFIDEFAEFVDYYVRALFIEDNKCDNQTQSLSESGGSLGILEETSSIRDSGEVTERDQHNCGTPKNFSTSSDNKDQTEKRIRKKSLQSRNTDSRNNVFSNYDSFDISCLKKSLLQEFVRGDNPEAAFVLRQLFFAASVLLRLNLQICSASLSLSLVPIFVGISQFLFVEMGKKDDLSSLVSLVWVDGVTKFLEELGSHLPLTDPILSRNVYVMLMELHFIAIGKCITLQGKSANLASHDTESSTKTLDLKMESSESTLSYGAFCVIEFKARLRRSFQTLVKKPTELHLQAALEALQRALVGLQVGSAIHYDIYIRKADGGRVSSTVAAAIDCMDLIIEFATGRNHLTIVKTHIHNLVACLFNIILHLQGPSIFFVNKNNGEGFTDPDSGSMVLMCVEVLTKVTGKHAIYYLDSVHVGQLLRIPGALFQSNFQLRCSKGVDFPNCQRFLANQSANSIGGTKLCVVDRRFSVELFAACCRLLGTIIKHYKSEVERCVALLEGSVSTLLHCLEMVSPDAMFEKQSFGWELGETVKCATFLRRIYEELRQQKDVFGRHCSLFLSSYISTYSGYGPLKIGIGREIDEALRPGVYALIEACSADDLQRLHTVFGEGPCRSTLADLQHDYKLNFQYEGKV